MDRKIIYHLASEVYTTAVGIKLHRKEGAPSVIMCAITQLHRVVMKKYFFGEGSAIFIWEKSGNFETLCLCPPCY